MSIFNDLALAITKGITEVKQGKLNGKIVAEATVYLPAKLQCSVKNFEDHVDRLKVHCIDVGFPKSIKITGFKDLVSGPRSRSVNAVTIAWRVK